MVASFDTTDVQRTMRRFSSRFPKAIRRARRRAATTARAQLARDVASDMRLKVTVVKEAIVLQDSASITSVIARTHRLPLYDFVPGGGDPRGPYPSFGRRVLRIRGKTYPGAFVARMTRAGTSGTHGGHWGIFKRVGDRRGPLTKELRYASIWQSAVNHAVVAQTIGLEALQKNLAAELNFASSVEGQ